MVNKGMSWDSVAGLVLIIGEVEKDQLDIHRTVLVLLTLDKCCRNISIEGFYCTSSSKESIWSIFSIYLPWCTMVWDSNSVFSLHSTFSQKMISLRHRELKEFSQDGFSIKTRTEILSLLFQIALLSSDKRDVSTDWLTFGRVVYVSKMLLLKLVLLISCFSHECLHHIAHLPYLLLGKTFEGRTDKLYLLLGLQSK